MYWHQGVLSRPRTCHHGELEPSPTQGCNGSLFISPCSCSFPTTKKSVASDIEIWVRPKTNYAKLCKKTSSLQDHCTWWQWVVQDLLYPIFSNVPVISTEAAMIKIYIKSQSIHRVHQISKFLPETHLLLNMVNMVNHAIPALETSTRPMPWWSPSWNSQSLLHIHYSCCEPSNTSQVWEVQFKMQMCLFRFVWHLFIWNSIHWIEFLHTPPFRNPLRPKLSPLKRGSAHESKNPANELCLAPPKNMAPKIEYNNIHIGILGL